MHLLRVPRQGRRCELCARCTRAECAYSVHMDASFGGTWRNNCYVAEIRDLSNVKPLDHVIREQLESRKDMRP